MDFSEYFTTSDALIKRVIKSCLEVEYATSLATEDILIPFQDQLVTGRTILFPEKGEVEAIEPDNYRSIACMNTKYMLSMTMLADNLVVHVEAKKSNALSGKGPEAAKIV